MAYNESFQHQHFKISSRYKTTCTFISLLLYKKNPLPRYTIRFLYPRCFINIKTYHLWMFGLNLDCIVFVPKLSNGHTTSKWHNDVDAMSFRRIDINATSLRHVLTDFAAVSGAVRFFVIGSTYVLCEWQKTFLKWDHSILDDGWSSQ